MCLKQRANAVITSLIMLFTCMTVPLIYALKGNAQSDYENYLSQQGFPQSYWGNLEALHSQYPQWIFKAQKTNLDWNDVVSNENIVGRNLVYKNSLNSWKSFDYGAYDFNKNDWVGFDSATWIAASKELIAYYLDPRNFINSTTIFMFQNQSYDSSTQTLDGIHKIVSGTFLDSAFPESDYSTYSDVLQEAAKESNVNPYVLASMIIQEQGSAGSSGSISGVYPGYEGVYNYFNINAYPTSSRTAIQSGLFWAEGSPIDYVSTSYGRPWNSRAKAIIGGAGYYGSNYVNIGQNNLYFKKFNVVHSSYYTHQYMTNIQGAESEAVILKKAYANVLNMAYTFNIPVYNNMPDTAAAEPTSNGTNNNLLTSLSIDGYSLTPTFTMYTTSYDLIVDKDTYTIHIQAACSDAGAQITSPLTVNLSDGNNTVPVIVKAPSGVQRTYTLNVYKEPNPDKTTTSQTTTTTATVTTTATEKPTTTTTVPTTAPTTAPTAPPAPSVSSSSYTISGMISNVKPDTLLNDFLSNISVSNAILHVVTSSGAQKSGNMATGDILQVVQNGSVAMTYPISVNGDINGDGKLTSYDLLQIKRYILKFSDLTGVYLEAADYNKDGKVSSYDLLQIKKYILKL